MKKSLRASMAALALSLAFGSVIVAEAQIRVGGYKAADTNDAEVVEAAEFAVEARKENEGGPLSLVSIKRAERQSVAGVNYRLCLEVKAADETDAGEDSQHVSAVVFRSLQKKFTLRSWEDADCGETGSEGNHSSASLPPAAVTSLYTSLSKCFQEE